MMNQLSLMILSCAYALLMVGCGTKLAEPVDAGADANASSVDDDDADGGGTRGDTDAGAGPIGPGRVVPCTMPSAVAIDKVDLLFVVDNSNSMQEEQAALKAQFPKLIRTLTTGKRSPNDPNPFPPATDVHLAVVSSDMGLLGVNDIKGCENFGDDGVMRDPKANSCAGGVASQRFLSYEAGVTDPDELATNFGCLADLGTGGCGFEQQLESGLKALWPEVDIDRRTGKQHTPNRVTFLKDGQGSGGFGHGDGKNAGFSRNDPSEGVSLLAIVVVSDEEDCSASNTEHFKPMSQLSPGDPNLMVDLNLRCWKNPQNLYSIKQRYLNAFKALRGSEELVVYAAIVGVPPDLVSVSARAGVDFDDEAERDAYYDGILRDSRMKPTADPVRPPGDGNLIPSCNTAAGKAYPPVRFVELAKAFGKQALVQSICEQDFSPAVDLIIEQVSDRLKNTCILE